MVTAYPVSAALVASLREAHDRERRRLLSWWPWGRRASARTVVALADTLRFLEKIEGAVFVKDGDFTAPELGNERPARHLGAVQKDDTLSMFMGSAGLFVGTVEGLRTYRGPSS